MLVLLRMVKGSGSIVDRPLLSMILSAADPEPASSSLSELSEKVKMVLPIDRLIIGLFACKVSLQLSSKTTGSPPADAYSSKIDECMSCTGYWNCLTVHAKGLVCDLVTLRCVLDGHAEVPQHLADAEKDRYSSLFKDVDVGTARRSCVISKMQGPIYSGGLSVCKSELGLGRDVLIGDDVLHWFDCLGKTLHCMPAAHRSGTSTVQNRIGRVVLRVDDRRRQLCCQKAVICCYGQIVF